MTGNRGPARERTAGGAGSRRRRGSGHQLREVVLHAATELLAQLGDVDALTMRAVAAAAGVSAPSVYRHFPDKHTLVRAVITDRFAEFTATLQTAARDAGTRGGGPLEELEAIAHAYVEAGLARPGHYRVLFSATGAGPTGLGLDPDTAHPGAASFRALVGAVAACLPPARHEDPSSPQTVLVLATELWASLHGLVDLRITKPEMPWPEPGPLIGWALEPVRSASRTEDLR